MHRVLRPRGDSLLFKNMTNDFCSLTAQAAAFCSSSSTIQVLTCIGTGRTEEGMSTGETDCGVDDWACVGVTWVVMYR